MCLISYTNYIIKYCVLYDFKSALVMEGVFRAVFEFLIKQIGQMKV